MERIELSIPKDITKLAGNSYGVKIYNEQVKDKYVIKDGCVIVFPKQIDRVASSFIQGFFSDIMNTMGYTAIGERIEVESSIKDLKSFIMSNLR